MTALIFTFVTLNLLLTQSVRSGRQSLVAFVRARRRVKLSLNNCLSRSARERLPLLKFSPGLFQKAAFPYVPSRSVRLLFVGIYFHFGGGSLYTPDGAVERGEIDGL